MMATAAQAMSQLKQRLQMVLVPRLKQPLRKAPAAEQATRDYA